MKTRTLLSLVLTLSAIILVGQPAQKLPAEKKSRQDIPEWVKNRKCYKRVEWFNTQRAWPYDTIPVFQYSNELSREINQVKNNNSKGNEDMSWTSIGPAGQQCGTTTWGFVSGRAKAIAVHPSDPMTLYIGAANGGIWKTTDGGQSWLDIGNDLASLSFGAIAIDPNNPETIYAGSGEVCYFLGFIGFNGKGIFKSTDGGNSWNQITEGIGSVTSFGDLVVSPFNSNVLLAALASGNYYTGDLPNEGLWKSTDAGEHWERILDVQDAFDIAFHPTDANKVFAAVGGGNSDAGFYISTDQGDTWNQSNDGLPATSSMHRLQIDVSQSNPDIIYAVIFDANTMSTKAYKSENGGVNWTQISPGTNLGGYSGGWYDQGFYDLCIAIDPENPNLVYIGNVEIHRTTNGSDFSPVRPYGNDLWGGLAHCDYHKLVFAPSDPDYLYIACDGGMYKSADKGYSAISQNQGLSTNQFYRVASHPFNPQIVIGGMQDNATAMTTDGGLSWHEVTGGDGMECLFNPGNPDTIYTSAQNGYFFRSVNGGATFSVMYNANGSWTTPFIMHPTNHKILYTANKSIIKSTTGGAPFQVIAPNVAPEFIVGLAMSRVEPEKMIFASGGTQQPVPGSQIVVKISTDGGYNWTDVTSNIPGEPRWITRVVCDPVDANTMYVLRTGFSDGNKVWKTTDLGLTWSNRSGNLPDLPCSDLFIDPENTNHLYVANDLGVYRSKDGGITWVYASPNIPFVPAIDFDYVKIGNDRYLRVGTHGRSIYQTLLPTSCLPEGITFTTQADIDNFQTNHPGCNEIEGEVIISGSDITNLNGLSNLMSVGGNLIIIKNDLLSNLSGLDALTYVDGYLEIGDVGDEGNPVLTSLTGLESLTSTGAGMSIRFNPVLTSFDGLENLISLGSGGFLLIQVNDALTDLTALSNLTTVGGSLRVEDNASLTSLAGLENIIPGTIDDLFINRNPLLTSCEVESVCSYLASPTGTVFIFENGPGCENPAEIAISCGTTFDCLPNGFYHFYSQSYIDNFSAGFPNCTVLNEYAVISGDDITNLEGLSQITAVDGDLWILGNPLLPNLSGLDNLSSITGELEISGNTALTDLTGLEGLISITENLIIGYWYPSGNTVLSSLAGLNNLWMVGGEIEIEQNSVLTSLSGIDNIMPGSVDGISILDNPALSTCDVQSICNYLALPNSTVWITNNAPGCNSPEEVEEACMVSVKETGVDHQITLFPNPADKSISIGLKGAMEIEEVTISNHLGQVVFQGKPVNNSLDVSALQPGVYFIEIVSDQSKTIKKLIIQ